MKLVDVPGHGAARYSREEMRAMRDLPSRELLVLHTFKVEFPGSVLDDGRGREASEFVQPTLFEGAR